MPYIKKEQRKKYGNSIGILTSKLQNNGACGIPIMGDVNYVISKILWDIFDCNPSYTLGNNFIGVLECVKQEMYRRKLAPYEDQKIKENGDI